MLFISLLFVFTGLPDDLIEIDGDHDLLRLLYVQQLSQESSFPRGELTSQLTEFAKSGDITRSLSVDCRVRWDGAATGWEYTVLDKASDVKSSAAPRSVSRLINESGDFILRRGKVPSFQTSDSQPLQLEPYLCLRPEDSWYKYGGLFPWSHFLLRAKFPSTLFRCKLRRDGEQIVLERELVKTGERGAIVFSSAKGLNVVSYEFGHTHSPAFKKPPLRAERIELEWKQLSDSNWQLTRMLRTEERASSATAGIATFRGELVVTAFEPNPKWSKADLRVDRYFQLPPNTVVTERTAKGTRRYRTSERVEDLTHTLDDLVQQLKMRRFAKSPK